MAPEVRYKHLTRKEEPKMNRHEIISRVYDHLMTQGEKCTRKNDSSMCSYRSRNKDWVYLACAIGALIDEDLYDERWNKKNLDDLDVTSALSASGITTFDAGDINYLEQLQEIHDNLDVCDWENKIIELADTWDL